jgi:hypothetical protein
MSPSARLIVYTIRPSNQEILVDATDFKVDGLFQNEVKLSLDKQTAEPGDTVKFTVNADPDSYVGLLAIDQSVLLLKSGNDITKELVCIFVLNFNHISLFRLSKISKNTTQPEEHIDLGMVNPLAVVFSSVQSGILGLELVERMQALFLR